MRNWSRWMEWRSESRGWLWVLGKYGRGVFAIRCSRIACFEAERDDDVENSRDDEEEGFISEDWEVDGTAGRVIERRLEWQTS